MGLMTENRKAMLCLGLFCIALALTAGCNYASYAAGDITKSDCDRLSGLDKDHCYKRLAVAQENPALCEEIDDPGPRSKCYLELGECQKLSFQATGDGAYTKYDCLQYKAISEHSIKLCEEYLGDYGSYNRNDLNPTGISKEICVERITEKCGHIGQPVCFDYYYKIDYCVEGDIVSRKCVKGS